MSDLLFVQKNFEGIARDISTGKQPADTVNDATNVVYDREVGSLVIRHPNENVAIAVPSGVSAVSGYLTKQVTFPSATDMHALFTEDGIFQYPYFHNGISATNDWRLITLNKSTGALTNTPTVNASPTNTIVLADTCTALGLQTAANYYKNWVIRFQIDVLGVNVMSVWFVKAYSVSSDFPTFTLDQVIDEGTGVTVTAANLKTNGFTLWNYFHSDRNLETADYFVPAFTDPAGYSSELAMRWSGGAGSTVGYKLIKTACLNKTFFNATSPDHTFQGTYVDVAECKPPASTIASSVTTADANANIITSENDFDFNGTAENWADNGSHTGLLGTKSIIITNNLPKENPKYREYQINANGLIVTATASGDLSSGGYVTLGSSFIGSMTHSVEYTLKFKAVSLGYANQAFDAKLRFGIYVNSTLYQSKDVIVTTNLAEQVVKFTIATTSNSPEIRIAMLDVGNGYANSFILDAISLTPTTSSALALPDSFTYKLYGSLVYDKFQESELTYLGYVYMTKKNSKLSYQLQQQLGKLNKFVTGARLYVSQEKDDTSSKGSITSEPKYLVADIPMDDDATSTWTFDTSQGRYEYNGGVNGDDWNNRGLTWEQKTGRTTSDSTTISASIFEQSAGRTFAANEYDYSESRNYVNRVRYTGFNGDGIPCPDIFPNIQDVFITTISSGQSQEVKTLLEYQGDLRIWKKNSYLNLTTSNPDVFTWRLQLIKDGEGCLSKYGAMRVDRGVLWSNRNGVMFEGGGFVKDLTKLGWWKTYYKSLVTTDAKAASQRVWYNYFDGSCNLAYDTTGSVAHKYLKFFLDKPSPVLIENLTSADKFTAVQTLSTGQTYFIGTASGFIMTFADSVSTNSTAITIDTGYRAVEIDKRALVSWVYFVAEGVVADTIVATIYGDGSTLVSAETKTIAATGRQFYKFQTAEYKPVKAVKLTISATNSNPQNGAFKLLEWGYAGKLVDEYTDV